MSPRAKPEANIFLNAKPRDRLPVGLPRKKSGLTINAPVEVYKNVQPRDLLQKVLGNPNCEDPFFVMDLSVVYHQWKLWRKELPTVQPFFAVKSNPDPMVLALLAQLGSSFDCASKSEIETVLSLGVQPSQIIYANPCKQTSHLKYANVRNVKLLTFDNADEVYKLKECHPNAEAVLRIRVDDSQAVCQLGNKFGTPIENVSPLLQIAKTEGLNVMGISFHVGSGCQTAECFKDALLLARKAWCLATDLGFCMKLLDIGGGFPGSEESANVTFEEISQVVRENLKLWQDEQVEIIAEPGRFFVEKAYTLAVAVIARRVTVNDVNQEKNFMYYINDGVYGSFNCQIFDHAQCSPVVVKRRGSLCHLRPDQFDQVHNSSVFGPTCDGLDRIHELIGLPELHIGDWLAYPRMGAYTICAASQFNGFKKSAVLYVDSQSVLSLDE